MTEQFQCSACFTPFVGYFSMDVSKLVKVVLVKAFVVADIKNQKRPSCFSCKRSNHPSDFSEQYGKVILRKQKEVSPLPVAVILLPLEAFS